MKKYFLSILTLSVLANTSYGGTFGYCDQSFTVEDLNKIESYNVKGRTTSKIELDEALKSRWISPSEAVESVSIVVHGANFRSDHMENVISAATNSNSLVLNVSLPGYREKIDTATRSRKKQIEYIHNKRSVLTPYYGSYQYPSLTKVDHLKNHPERKMDIAQLQQQLFKAYCIAKKVSDDKGVQLSFVGYSMGAVAFLSLMNSSDLVEKVDVDKMMLLAPAFMNKNLGKVFSFISKLAPGVKISRDDFDYSFVKGYSMKDVMLTVQANKILEQNGLANSNIETVVIVNSEDSMISQKLISDKIENEMTNWSLVQVNDFEVEGAEHIIVKKDYTGAKQWQSIQSVLADFF